MIHVEGIQEIEKIYPEVRLADIFQQVETALGPIPNSSTLFLTTDIRDGVVTLMVSLDTCD